MLASGSRLVEGLTILSEHRRGEAPVVRTRWIGAPMIFSRFWEETGCRRVLEGLLADRRFEFPAEREIFLEVLHRLVRPSSDRSGNDWREDYGIERVSLVADRGMVQQKTIETLDAEGWGYILGGSHAQPVRGPG